MKEKQTKGIITWLTLITRPKDWKNLPKYSCDAFKVYSSHMLNPMIFTVARTNFWCCTVPFPMSDMASSDSDCHESPTSLEERISTATSSESGSDTSTSHDSHEEEESAILLRTLKNQQRTAKARIASILSKAKKKMGFVNKDKHAADEFQPYLHPSTSSQPTPLPRASRIRLLVSWLSAWGQAIASVFRSKQVNHTLCTAIVDDTNMRLSEPWLNIALVDDSS